MSHSTPGLPSSRSFSAGGRSRSGTSVADNCRPGTATSTSRAHTATSFTGAQGGFIVAVLEARDIGREVGIAGMDRETGACFVTQLADTQTYVHTTHHLSLHPPSVILLPASSFGADSLRDASSAMADRFRRRGAPSVPMQKPAPGSTRAQSTILLGCIAESFPDAEITPINRDYWNDQNGFEYVGRLVVEDEDERTATLTAIRSKYYAMSAFAALFKYLETAYHMVFTPKSLLIKYVAPGGTMFIDPESARNLELVGNMINKKSKASLFGLLNQCITPMGERLLRMNILQPLLDRATINKRLDVVEELLQTEERFDAIRKALGPLANIDLDKLAASLVRFDRRAADIERTESRIRQLLDLRSAVRAVKPVKQALEGVQEELLQHIKKIADQPEIESIAVMVDSVINEDAAIMKKGPLAVRNARIYAVKANHNPFLDVARETYKENVGDAVDLCTRYTEVYNLPLSLTYVNNNFVLVLAADDIKIRDMPAEFTNVIKRGRNKIHMTTLELKKINQRIDDSLMEVFLMSDQIVEALLQEVIGHISSIYQVSEGLGLLDMLGSFAYLATVHDYVRPEFTGTLAIKGGRHPLLDRFDGASVVPNDAYAAEHASFYVVTGPNMSGKSTFLRQLALLQVMAMVGSFVPAQYASFRLHDAILTRLSNDDDIEQNLSTFAQEMRSAAFILSLATENSLVLCDEMGRGTAPYEGIGISYAIAEDLIKSRAFVFFATHFKELTTSLAAFPSVVNLHLHVQVNKQAEHFSTVFSHRVLEGYSKEEHTGLELAKLAGLPRDVFIIAKSVSEELNRLEKQRAQAAESSKVVKRRKIMLRLHDQLKQGYQASNLSDSDLVRWLAELQREIVSILQKCFEDRATTV